MSTPADTVQTSEHAAAQYARWKHIYQERKTTLARLLVLQQALQDQKQETSDLEQQFFQARTIYLSNNARDQSRYKQAINDLLDYLHMITRATDTASSALPNYLDVPLQAKELLICTLLETHHWISLLDKSAPWQHVLQLLRACAQQPPAVCFPGLRVHLENAETQLQNVLRWKRTDANVYVPGQEDQDVLEDNPDEERYLLERAGYKTTGSTGDIVLPGTLSAEAILARAAPEYTGGGSDRQAHAARADDNEDVSVAGRLTYDDLGLPDDEAHLERLLRSTGTYAARRTGQ